MAEITDPAVIRLTDVRLSFPHLFKAHAMNEESEAKFSATFLMDNEKHASLLEHIDNMTDRMALEEFKKKINFKRPLRDGNEKPELDGYGDGVSFITASRKTRPFVVNQKVQPVEETDNLFFSGCYVIATIKLWVQNNKWGKRVNAELRAVQFLRKGEAFGAGAIDITKEFDAIDEEVAGNEAQGAARQRSRPATAATKPVVSLDDI